MITDVVVKPARRKGKGVFALRAFRKGEFIFRRRHGRVVSNAEIRSLSREDQSHLCELDFKTSAHPAPARLLPKPLLRSERDAQRRQGLRLAKHEARRGG